MSIRNLGQLLIGLICVSIVFYFTLVIVGIFVLGAIYAERQEPEPETRILSSTAAPEADDVPGEIRIAKLRGVDPAEFFQPIGTTGREPMGSVLNRVLTGNWSPRDLQQLARRRDAALTELKLLYEGTSDTAGKVRIVAIMNQLGDRSIRDQLASDLLDATETEQQQAIEDMRIAYLWKGDLTSSERKFLTKLAHDGPGKDRGTYAALLANDPQSAAAALELFEFIPANQQAELAWRMAADERAGAVASQLLPLLESTIRDETGAGWIAAMEALLNLSRNAEGESAKAALTRAELEHWKQDDDVRFDPRLAQAWFRAARTSSLGILEDIEKKATDPISRGYASAAIARLDGIESLPQVLERVQQPGKAFGGYLALSELYRQGHQPEIEAALAETPLPPPSQELIRLMIQRGDGQALDWFATELDQLGPLQQMQVTWLREQLRLEHLAIALEQAGLTPRPVDLAELRTQSTNTSGLPIRDHELVWNYLEQAGLARTIELETTGSPVPHHQLVQELAEFSRGDLDLLHWEQQRRPDGLGYDVRFIHKDDVFQFPVRNQGNAFDLTRILEALNGALIQNRRPERFLRAQTPGSPAHVVYGDPLQWESIQERFAIPVEKPPTPVLRRESSL